MDLVKKQIHMNRWKGNVTTQVTLDDDFIVPDTMDDMAQVLLDSGEIQIESVKNQGERVLVKGKLEFSVLYRKAGGGLQTLGGVIPFEEAVNVPGLEEHDDVSLNTDLEDLSTGMVNSRKLGVKAIVTLEIRVECLCEAEAAAEVAEEPEAGGILQQKENVTLADIAARRKDTYRIREQLSLPGNKLNIGQLLWKEMRLGNILMRPGDGRMKLEGTLEVFIIYAGEGDEAPVQWWEETIPFSGEVELAQAEEEMIPMVKVRLAHKDVEARPDYDGEMRDLDVDGVLDLDMKLYQEQQIQLLNDVYSMEKELVPVTREACFEQILTKNSCKCRAVEKFSLDQPERILQICHSSGIVKIDEVAAGEDQLTVDGAVEVTLLYLTNDDSAPIQSAVRAVPFHCAAETPGIQKDSVFQVIPSLEQLTAAMLGGDSVEIRASVALDILVMQQICQTVITDIEEQPLDLKKLQEMPGIVGYIVQPGDSLWKISKKFHTTVENIMAMNELADDGIRPGTRLILVKQVAEN